MKFSKEKILEKTIYGDVLGKVNGVSKIYINGVKVVEEPNFLFSYNITSLTKQIKKALNRERTNVGRTAYSDRIRSILLNAISEDVISALINDFQQFNSGLRHDELLWRDISIYAIQMLKRRESNTVFVTPQQVKNRPDIVDEMNIRGFKTIICSEDIFNIIAAINNDANEEDIIPTVYTFISDLEENREYKFISPEQLNQDEKKVYAFTEDILFLVGGKPSNVTNIKISETIYDSELFIDTVGYWDPNEGLIVIKRSQLKCVSEYAGTLVHELVHAGSRCGDVSRGFEQALTLTIGEIVKSLLE